MTGEDISAIRKARGVSRKELADGVGLTASTVGRYERGELFSGTRIRQMATYLSERF